MKNFTAIIIAICLLSFNACKTKVEKSEFERKREGQRERQERDVKMMKDPALGIVPTDRLIAAKEYKDQLIQSQSNIAIAGITWRQLGPKNQGGRSRAVLIDANDATGNTIFAGSVGGGLWKTTNINTTAPTWTPINDFFDNLAITSIFQDPSNAQTMYFCTGEEGYFNGDAIRGLGVWKSTNGGTTWSQLSATNNANFYNCYKVVVNSTGVVMVATTTGLRRSTDGGATWTIVLGNGTTTGAASNLCYDVEIAANGDVYGALRGSIHKSTNAGATFAAAQTLPISADRIELAIAPSDANYVYATVELGFVVNGIIRTTDGGTTWTSRTEPDDADPEIPAADFSRGQAWYDLSMAVDPNNREVVFVGGIDLFKSIDGGGTWSQISHWYGGFGFQYVHADQHHMVFKPGSSSILYFVNDGGVYQSTNATNAVPTITDKGTNYVTAQFYACAIHPTALSTYFLAGAQDNGSHQFTQGVLQNTTEVTGGDGAFCHIDQNEPQYQFTSYVFNDFYRSTNGGASWTNVVTTGGEFISPTDYDDAGNILYMADAAGSYRRWTNAQTGSTFSGVAVTEFGGANVSALKVSPNASNRVFFGLDNGDVVRVDNANGTHAATNISTGLPTAYISCVEVQDGDDNHLLVTYSNYGVTSIYETTNGGTSWTQVEGNLPDMPVRWALFNPNNSDQAVIATELGVWSTDNLNGAATNWGTSNNGLANVRVDMLQIRTSDKVMIAATHGRGLFSSSSFATPTAMFEADKIVTYRGVPINFTSTSYNATSWSWNFGDATSSTVENPSKFYSAAGKYNVTLTINSGASTLTKNLYIHVLPNRGTPYTPAVGGNFDTAPDDFGTVSLTGNVNKWERGVPTNVLTTVNSSPNAWKTDLDADLTSGTYSCALMTPNYNFTATGSYLLRFRRSMEVVFCNAPFAVQVQYTTDKGLTWNRLGVNADPLGTNWYNNGPSIGGCAMPTTIFSDGYGWILNTSNTQSSYDVSFLATNPNVAFRFVLSVAGGYSAAAYAADGFMVDDFEIVGPINIALAVKLINFTAVKQSNNVLVNWNTKDEVNINKYVIQRSTDGISFVEVGNQLANNNTTNSYQYNDINAVNINSQFLYYRLKITDNAGKLKYSEVVKVDLRTKDDIITISPNPFSKSFVVNTSATVRQIEFYNTAGALQLSMNNLTSNRVEVGNKLPSGIYFVKIIFTNGKTVTQKLMKSS
jgi:PKD repeat protein/photosystem II stability/assembly factor-like uncharacterized protein